MTVRAVHRPLGLSAIAVLVLAACSSPGASPAIGSTTSPVASGTDSAQVVAVSLTDALRIEPAQMTVATGRPVRFVVTNTGAIDHEFYVGDEAAQTEHEEQMGMGGMQHGEEAGIALAPGETKTLELTFDAVGTTLAGCHVEGHYAGGMKETIIIEG